MRLERHRVRPSGATHAAGMAEIGHEVIGLDIAQRTGSWTRLPPAARRPEPTCDVQADDLVPDLSHPRCVSGAQMAAPMTLSRIDSPSPRNARVPDPEAESERLTPCTSV